MQINTERIKVRTVVPSYGHGDSSYTPWVLGHTDEKALDDEVLQGLFDEFRPQFRFEDTLFSEFYDWLTTKGYVTFYMAGYDGMAVVDVQETRKGCP